ncbi:MAG: HAMP domain-containing sensor histidine kinase [Lachnospiraceae bacterium]|nr:HAMP domain-containing sensor histidine kinase [Lachnospiraceae bacterium]
MLLIISAVLSVILFVFLETTGTKLMDRFYDSEYGNRKNKAYVKELQKYVKEEYLSYRDTDKISSWVKKQKIIYVQIYKDGVKVFDSVYPDQEEWGETIDDDAYLLERFYFVEFAEGVTSVSITGVYSYQLYQYAMMVEELIAFVFFIMLVLLGIRRKMKYIRRLGDEVEILEGGSLDYEITVKGKDELARLAESVENMRKAFNRLITQETEMIHENQRIVTEMSHDLRTPVTSIMLYTEILKKGKYKDEKQLLEYIEKIDRKAHAMKQLTENLFEYSLVTGENDIELEKAEQYEVIFYDLFSETCSYLEEKGFRAEFKVEWSQNKVRISSDYIIRIMDNITSNIVKYADTSFPVCIASISDNAMDGFVIENKIKENDEKIESTGIGIQSIKNMMMKMGGKCLIEEENDIFRLILLFTSYHTV